MSRIVFLILGLVILQTVAATSLVEQAEKLFSDDFKYRIKRDTNQNLVFQAEKLLREKRAAPTSYSQPGTEPMQIKIMALN